MVVEAWEMAATKDINAVILNESTYVVVYKVQFNKTLTLSYLYSVKKYLSNLDYARAANNDDNDNARASPFLRLDRPQIRML